MFIGEFRHTMDPKNRISIPSKFREDLGERFYVTKGLDSCLFVYTEEEWRKFEAKLRTLPLSNKNARAFARTFLSGAHECSIDKAGRVLIPQPLKEFASLDKEVFVNGAGSRIEIWDVDRWNAYIDEVSADMESIAEGMENLEI
ncbi:MAG: division/cell wall cluster transcriptional repressor MraZ [Bacillota bacterium]|nr:division/cell wall cluster transcriptional repressor MraZ [Bacillota bacterium]